MMTKAELTSYIKAEALRLGFDVCGISQAKAVDETAVEIQTDWVKQGKHATMQYMERNCDKRFDPSLLVEGCRSIICVAMNYAPKQVIEGIANYAQGKDYHKTVKERLFLLLKSINERIPCKGRAFCDSAPVLERYWARMAGIGYIGRNRQLIIPGRGSYFFLGELFVDIELEYDMPEERNLFGNCPAGALDTTGLDAGKCLSYLTIEHRGDLPENIGEKMKNQFYGCDRCQAVCPHNRFSTPNGIPELQPSTRLLQMRWGDWENLTEQQYNEIFAGSAVERCGYAQLKRNIKATKR